jgi:hypothetical protein
MKDREKIDHIINNTLFGAGAKVNGLRRRINYGRGLAALEFLARLGVEPPHGRHLQYPQKS